MKTRGTALALTSFAALAAAVAFVGCSSKSTNIADGDGGLVATDGGAPETGVGAGTVDAGSGDWSCIGSVVPGTPTGTTATIGVHLIEPVQGKAVAGIAVRACPDLSDVTCASAGDGGIVTTDSNGDAKVVVPLGTKGFAGYFEASLMNDVTNLTVVYPPLLGDSSPYQRVQWSSTGLSVIFSTADGFASDSTKYGIIGFEAHDCAHKIVDGVSAELVGSAPSAHLGYINTAASKLDDMQMATDKSGQGGWANVPPGPVTVRFKVAATGKLITEMTVPVRIGAFTGLVPAPSP